MLTLQQFCSKYYGRLEAAITVAELLLPLAASPHSQLYPSRLGISRAKPHTVQLDCFPTAGDDPGVVRGAWGLALLLMRLVLRDQAGAAWEKLAMLELQAGIASGDNLERLLQRHAPSSRSFDVERAADFVCKCMYTPVPGDDDGKEWEWYRQELLQVLQGQAGVGLIPREPC